MIIEVCKRGDAYLRQYYHNNPLAMVKAGDGLQWTPERIKSAFKFGHGTTDDLREYMENNRKFAAFYDDEKGAFI